MGDIETNTYSDTDRQKDKQSTPPFPAVAAWREGEGRKRGWTRPRLTEENKNQLPRKTDKWPCCEETAQGLERRQRPALQKEI